MTDSTTTSDSKTYIVTLKEDVADPAIAKFKETVSAAGGKIEHEYTLIKGYVVKLPSSLHAESISKDTSVATIEEDSTVKANSA